MVNLNVCERLKTPDVVSREYVVTAEPELGQHVSAKNTEGIEGDGVLVSNSEERTSWTSTEINVGVDGTFDRWKVMGRRQRPIGVGFEGCQCTIRHVEALVQTVEKAVLAVQHQPRWIRPAIVRLSDCLQFGSAT